MSPRGRTFVGFGFGAIQAGLFLFEAHRAGCFRRLVVAEVDPGLVAALREAGGSYRVNVATAQGLECHTVPHVEILNPRAAEDRPRLRQALAEADEMATALPSVDFYTRGEPTVAALLAEAWARKTAEEDLPAAVIYTAENHNHAAELLAGHCRKLEPGISGARLQCLNTVIGKMSGVADLAEEPDPAPAPVTPGAERAFLVEAFRRILISSIDLPGYRRGIGAFIEKEDLLPFEEAKLYGHNAVHALLGYAGHARGCRVMSDLAGDPDLTALARRAFLEESGAGLCFRHRGRDPLFTPEGFRAYAEDLLERMFNPYLRDRIARVIRDPGRKLGWDDRLLGAMRLALEAGVEPRALARGAAGARQVLEAEGGRFDTVIASWPDTPERQRILALIAAASIPRPAGPGSAGSFPDRGYHAHRPRGRPR